MLAPSSPWELNDAAGLPDGLTLPLALTGSLRLTPEEFDEVCAANPDAVLERAPDGALIPMTPTGARQAAATEPFVLLLARPCRQRTAPQAV